MIPVRNSTKQKRQILGQRQKEVDGAQEWPEWAMQVGEAEWRRVGQLGPGRGQWCIPARPQEEANWDLEETEERPPVTKAASV